MSDRNSAVATNQATNDTSPRHDTLVCGLPVAPTLSVRHFAKNETVFAEGDYAGWIYKVLTGAARSTKLLSDGRRQITAFHFAGDIFGLESGQQHRLCVESLGNCTIETYCRSGIDSVASTDSNFTHFILTASLVALGRAQEHVLLLGRKSAIEKMAAFVLDLSSRFLNEDQIDLPMSRADIADHLGLTISTVSRALTVLIRNDIISIPAHRRSLTLRDRAALTRLNA